MKRLIQELFINYETEMEPNIDVDLLRQKMREKNFSKSTKLTFPKLPRLVRVLTSVVLVFMIGFILHTYEVRTYLNTNFIFINQMNRKFDVFLEDPILSEKVCCNTNLNLFYGKLNDEDHLIVYPNSKQTIQIKIYQDDILLLNYVSSTNQYKSIILNKDINVFDIFVYKKNEVVYFKQIVINTNELG